MSSANSMRLFVGGLSYNTTEQGLKEFFESGSDQEITVVESTVVRDPANQNRSKGFGFVTLQTEKAERDVIQDFNSQRLDGRNVTVNSAKPRAPKEGGGEHGDRGSRGGYDTRHSGSRH